MKQAIKKRIMLRSRRSKLDHFYSLLKPGESVLDVGVTAKDKSTDEGPLNYLLKTYPNAPDTYTGLGVHDVSGLQKAHPDKRFVQYDGKIFPFGDNEFDWVFSNAVIEHVGDHDAQLLFLKEMLRVSRYVFFTTPNKYFPIETHTYVPFLHWNERLFDKWLWKHKPKWRSKTGLWLLSANDVHGLMREAAARHYELHKNRFMLWPMTITIVASKSAALPSRKPARRAQSPSVDAEAPA